MAQRGKSGQAKHDKIFQFKIILENIKPPIWRRIQVPESYTFWDLHVAIQDAMGWCDGHLHQFETVTNKPSDKIYIGIPSDEDPYEIKKDWEEKISDWYDLEKNNKMNYTYDFGDNWDHKIVLEKILLCDGSKYPRCIDGKMACPPEDCGGVWGYEDLIEIIKNPKHKEYKEMKEWLGGDFDPEAFNCSEVVFDNPASRLKEMLKYNK